MPRALVILVIALAVGCAEQRESSYRTRAELDAAGPGARSWFPQWLPNDATDLREWHDLDTNITIGGFTSIRAFQPPSRFCKPSRFSHNPGDHSWWPNEARFRGLEHFACVEPLAFSDGRVESRSLAVAIDRATGEVYFWRERG